MGIKRTAALLILLMMCAGCGRENGKNSSLTQREKEPGGFTLPEALTDTLSAKEYGKKYGDKENDWNRIRFDDADVQGTVERADENSVILEDTEDRPVCLIWNAETAFRVCVINPSTGEEKSTETDEREFMEGDTVFAWGTEQGGNLEAETVIIVRWSDSEEDGQ